MKHTYLIESEKRAALEALVQGALGFVGQADVQYEEMVRVVVEDDRLADVLDLVLQARELPGQAPAPQLGGNNGWVHAPADNGEKPAGTCTHCGGPTRSKRTRWCDRAECKKAQQESWNRGKKEAAAEPEPAAEAAAEPAAEARAETIQAPFARRNLPVPQP